MEQGVLDAWSGSKQPNNSSSQEVVRQASLLPHFVAYGHNRTSSVQAAASSATGLPVHDDVGSARPASTGPVVMAATRVMRLCARFKTLRQPRSTKNKMKSERREVLCHSLSCPYCPRNQKGLAVPVTTARSTSSIALLLRSSSSTATKASRLRGQRRRGKEGSTQKGACVTCTMASTLVFIFACVTLDQQLQLCLCPIEGFAALTRADSAKRCH